MGAQPPPPEEPALTDEVRACASASERGQEERDAGRLIKARGTFIECAREACPDVVRNDCSGWAEEASRQIPTIVPVARDARGQDVAEVTLSIDGNVVTKRLEGRPIEVDPGEHRLRWEDQRGTVVERIVVVGQGEKNRRIEATLEAQAKDKPKPPPEVPWQERVPVATWLLGGIGLAGIGVFAGLAGVAVAEREDLREGCAPHCTDEDVDAVRAKLIGANVSLGAGAAAIVVGTILLGVELAASPPEPAVGAATARLVVGPTSATLSVAF